MTADEIKNVEIRLKAFLREKQAYSAFNEGIKQRGYYSSISKYLERYAWHKLGVHRLISHAFTFSDTKQGRDYWLAIHSEWCKLMAK